MTPLGAVERLKPPHDLSDEEVEIWVSVTNTESADHFSPSTAPLLAQYCRHVISARQIAEIKERAHNDMDLAALDKLLQMQARESAAISMLATKMRVAQQSTTNHRGNKNKPTQARKLWDW
jgi:inhibitor of KinA sporulation pathway (predicted exonuclease)